MSISKIIKIIFVALLMTLTTSSKANNYLLKIDMYKFTHVEAFEIWYKHISGWEGSHVGQIVYVDGDGVATNHGIRETTWNQIAPNLFGIAKVDLRERFVGMSENEHKEMARHFWKESGADYMSDPRVGAFFAESFWGGGYAALKDIQRFIRLRLKKDIKADGFPRQKTADAIDFVDMAVALEVFKEERKTLSRLADLQVIRSKDVIDEKYQDLVSRYEGTDKDIVFGCLIFSKAARLQRIIKAKVSLEKNARGWFRRLYFGDNTRQGFAQLYANPTPMIPKISFCKCCNKPI